METVYYKDMKMHKRNSETGIVSILTVLFLTVLLSIITVAFLRVMNDEQIQTIQDDLTKSAYASALTGIEDAKRAYTYCQSLSGSARTDCLNELTNTSCPGAMSSSILTSGPTPVISNSGQVGGDPNLNQRYTCLLVRIATSTYMGQSSESTPRLIELAPESGSFRTATIRWHKIGDGENRDGPANFYTGTSLPRYGAWTSSGQPAVGMLRVQVVAFEGSSGSGVTLADMDRKSTATFFVPRSPSTPVPANLGRVSAPQTGTASWSFTAGSRQDVPCTTNQALYGGYSCEVDIDLGRTLSSPQSASDRSRYFLLVSSVYDDPHFEVSMEDSSGGLVNFYDVQPEIDVTGAAADAYRRVQARVEYSGGFTSKDAIQTATSLCKGFYVTNEPVNVLAGGPTVYGPDPAPKAPGAVCSGLTTQGARYAIPD